MPVESQNFQGIILAAGIGTRLRPLTTHVPKPLIPFFGTTPFALAHSQLVRAGISSIGANSHYLSERIKDAALKLPGNRVEVSVELPDILGTAGLLNLFAKWLLAKNVILYNSDIVSDISVTHLCQTHMESGAAATMVLLAKGASGKTPVFVDAEGWVVGIGSVDPSYRGDHRSLTQTSFAGVHALSQSFISKVPKSGPSESIPIYRSLISEGRLVKAYLHSGCWFDIGDPLSLFEAYRQVAFVEDSKTVSLRKEDLLGLYKVGTTVQMDEALVTQSRSIRRGCWISPEVILPEGVTIERSIALPGAIFSPGERVVDEIRGYGESIHLKFD